MRDDIYKRVSQELGISESTVRNTYKSFWYFIRLKMREIADVADNNEEDLHKIKTSISIHRLGKIYFDHTKFKYIKNIILNKINEKDKHTED